MNPLIALGLGVAAWETAAWLQRMHRRKVFFEAAERIARQRGKPLLIVGKPMGWDKDKPSGFMRHGCGCPEKGDTVIDIVASAPECAANFVQADASDLSRWPDGHFGSAFVSCTLEHIDDIAGAWRELHRVTRGPGGSAVFVNYPQHMCLFAFTCGAHKWLIKEAAGGRLVARRLR